MTYDIVLGFIQTAPSTNRYTEFDKVIVEAHCFGEGKKLD